MTLRIILRHLVFTGPDVDPSIIEFESGLNIVYGASNTGKSFIMEALNFMLGGGDPLPNIEQRKPYEAVLLGMNVPELGDVTLYRAIAGGAYQLFNGLHRERPVNATYRKLSQKHSKVSDNNLSALLLKLLKIEAREVVKKGTGEKESFTFRSVAPYVLVGEDAMLSKQSPALSSQRTSWPADRSILKIILSAMDDSAVVPSPNPEFRKAAVSGKVELIDELLAGIEAEIDGNTPPREEIEVQLATLRSSVNDLHSAVKERQTKIDHLINGRRHALDRYADINAEIGELELTVGRFNELDTVYDTDLKRLASIDEGGGMLLAMAARSCQLCGALPEHQFHDHGLSETQAVQTAAKIEMEKIVRDRQALTATTLSLKTEINNKVERQTEVFHSVGEFDAGLDELRPLEATMRSDYEAMVEQHGKVSDTLKLLLELERLTIRKTELLAERKSPDKPKLELGPSDALGHELAMVIQNVLRIWHYPGDVAVSFDMAKLDIRLDGKLRTDNGKGVRAILHAAFKVGVLLFCHKNALPHPGFLVLDTPLLTYREPLKNARHGDLAADEEALKATSLREHFYTHLASLGDKAQFIILENVDPPADLSIATTTLFTGELGNDRFGLFPAL